MSEDQDQSPTYESLMQPQPAHEKQSEQAPVPTPTGISRFVSPTDDLRWTDQHRRGITINLERIAMDCLIEALPEDIRQEVGSMFIERLHAAFDQVDLEFQKMEVRKQQEKLAVPGNGGLHIPGTS